MQCAIHSSGLEMESCETVGANGYACARCEATIVLSGYPSDLYDKELCDDRGWLHAEIDVMSILNVRGEVGVQRTEVIWANRPILDAFTDNQVSLFDILEVEG